jgi:FtsZ-binding cell division protein ZapB
MDFVSDLNSIEETLARGKSIVKESIDLTRKNAERKKEIERKLQNCFSISAQKAQENSFTLDLENNQISIISKEKNQESYMYNEDAIKLLNIKIEDLEKEKNYSQRKLGELQDIAKDLETENFSLKSKIRGLVTQLKNSDEELNRFSEEFLKIKDENERILKENQEMTERYEKVLKENLVFKSGLHRNSIEIEKNLDQPGHEKRVSSLSKKNISLDEKNQDIPFETESSTETYYQFFKNLKKNVIDSGKSYEKPGLTPLLDTKEDRPLSKVQKSDYLIRKKTKNEDILEKLEEKYKKTDEKLKKISSSLAANPNSTSKKKLSISFDNAKNTETTKPKITVKIKHKRALPKTKRVKK